MKVGDRLRALIIQRGWTQTKLSDISGVTQTTISTIEQGATPNVEIAKRLNSPEFSAMVANYLLGVPTASSDKDLLNTDLAQVVHLFNEEKLKEAIKEPFMEALVHKTRSNADREIAMDAILMFQEEAGLETQVTALTIEEFGINDRELKKHKELRDHERNAQKTIR